MKTKTAVVVVKAQEQEMHRQEEESRWAAEMQTAKENETTQQEEDSRWAAAKGTEEADAAEENSRSRGRRGGMVWQAAKHLPANLKPFERQLVHEMAEEAGLSHESVGKGATRHIVLQHKTIFV